MTDLEYATALKLPPDDGWNDALVGLGDDLARAFNALASPDGHVGASRWMRKAFVGVGESGFYHLSDDDLDETAPDRIEGVSPVHSVASVGHTVEGVFQHGGGITVWLHFRNRVLYLTVEPYRQQFDAPLSVKSEGKAGHAVGVLRRYATAFRDQFPYDLGANSSLPETSLLRSGLGVAIQFDGETAVIGSNSFTRPSPDARPTSMSRRRVQHVFEN